MSFMAVLAVCGSANTFAAVSSEVGSVASDEQRINSFLAAQNLAGKPAISDKRLFPACESDVLVRPMFGGMKTVELFCPDPWGFKIAVRTNAVSDGSKRFLTGDANQIFDEDRLKSTVEKYLAMARSVQKGQILSHDDVVLREADAKNRTGYFVKVSDVVGRKVKQKLSVNQVILSRHLEIDWDIQKGQKIIIQSTAGPVVVVSSGILWVMLRLASCWRLKISIVGKLVEGIVVSQKKIKVLTK